MGAAKKILRVILYSALGILSGLIILLILLLVLPNLSSAPEGTDDTFSESITMGLNESEMHSESSLYEPDFVEPQMSDSLLKDYETFYIDNAEEHPPSFEPESPGYSYDYSQSLLPLNVSALSEDLQTAIDSIAERHRAIGVQVAVIQDGAVYGVHSFGYATRGADPMTEEHKIRAASLTKPVLAMTIVALADKDMLDIDEDISEYWEMTIRNPNRRDYPITIRQMLTHTSSLNDFPLGFRSSESLLREQFRDGTIFRNATPGRIGSWLYSNFAYTALGVTVEVATGETVNNLASELLFEPLGIDAAFGSGSVERTDLLATLYNNGGSIGRSLSRQIETLGSTFPGETGVEFSGGLAISAIDLAQLLAVLINHGEYRGAYILSPEAVSLMEYSAGSAGGFEQLLSMRRVSGLFGEEVLIYHTGSNFGMFALMSYNPISGNGVVVLTTGARDERNALFMRLICAEISEYIYEYLRTKYDYSGE